jgi:transcriptional regulator with XRE-family HTH domain
MTIAEKIKDLRKEKGMSQAEFAKGLGAGQQTVSGWENGVIEPTISKLKKIADFCGVNIDYFKDDQKQVNIIKSKDSVTELLDRLVKEGKIKTPEDISGGLVDLIMYAVKADAQMRLLEQSEQD